MHILIIYLIKAAIFQALLLAFYWLLLRRDTFYKMNRFYFMGGILLSLIIPLINFDISSWFRHKQIVQNVFVYQYIPDLSFKQLTPWWQQFSLSDYTLMFFITGAIIMLLRLVIQYRSIKKLGSIQQLTFEEYDIKLLEGPVNPFSFGKTIYVNPRLHSEKELEEIIEHELVHVIQRHSVDIIIASINRSIFWWNPAAWLLNKVMRDNLEYIADRIILEKGFDRKHYQYHLLRISQLAYPNTIAQHFNFSNLKKRITMMNKKETSRYQKMKWLLLVPVAGILLLSFNYRNNIQHQITNIAGSVNDNDTIPYLPPSAPPPAHPNSKGNYVDVRNYNGECIVVVESNKQEPIARIPLTKWDADKKNYVKLYGEIQPPAPPAAPRPPLPPAAPKLPENVATINISRNDQITDDVVKRNSIATVTLKNGQQETYNLDIPGERQSYEKKYGPLPAAPLPPPPPPVPTADLKGSVSAVIVSPDKIPDDVLYSIDGRVVDKVTLEKLPVEAIVSIDVFKGEQAITLYGEKGKNGVVEVRTKASKGEDVLMRADTIKIRTKDNTITRLKADSVLVRSIPQKNIAHPLYVVDGVVTTETAFNETIKPADIISMSVLKGVSGTALYGDKGKDGVLIITTKHKNANLASPVKIAE